MKGWPASAEIEPMLQIAPSTPSRIISLIASCIRKKGPCTLIANILSNRSGVVSRIVPRSVDAPATDSSTGAAGTVLARAPQVAPSANVGYRWLHVRATWTRRNERKHLSYFPKATIGTNRDRDVYIISGGPAGVMRGLLRCWAAGAAERGSTVSRIAPRST